MSDVAAFLFELSQQVWQQQEGGREEGGAVCFVGIAPVLLGAAALGLRAAVRRLRARPIQGSRSALGS